jgi:alanyl-tRNA synthetase
MDSFELRRKYLDFFISKGHKEIAAAGLLAENDPTLLFVNSGMFPLVPYLLGQKHPEGTRLVNSQRSFRSDDIDEIGDQRHTTFFEMLGNWSLGDYFKQEQLSWLYEFLIEQIKLDPKKLYQSVFAGNNLVERDEESIKIIQENFKKYGIEAEVGPATTGKGELGPGVEVDFSRQRIFPYVDKNWWKRGDAVGELGGPDSETFYDTGAPHDTRFGQFCHPNCDCGRFIEIGNSVFMQYKKTPDSWEPMAQRNVDYGGGLERLLMVLDGQSDMFRTDLFWQYIQSIELDTGKSYADHLHDSRLICDHVRAATFLIADGGVPSNKDQGYYIRRLIRRTLVSVKSLGGQSSLVEKLARQVIEKMSPAYPYLAAKSTDVIREIADEVDKFSRTLEKGVKYFELAKPVNGVISGEDVFNLTTTYGFPLEITTELAAKKGLKIDLEDYYTRIEHHKDLSRQGSEQKFKSGLIDTTAETTRLHTATHLLHQALRTVLGTHVEQRGSNITPERLRFDFSHPAKMTPEEIKKVEDIVNAEITKGLEVYCTETSPEEAKKQGAIGLFNDKYTSNVTVYTVGAPLSEAEKAFSKEICTGPHVKNLSELGGFKIVKEEASSAGIRRIKAVVTANK